jgi:hypothetical protein
LQGEKIEIKEGQIYIYGQILDTFYGKETHLGKEVKQGAYTMEKDVILVENHSN